MSQRYPHEFIFTYKQVLDVNPTTIYVTWSSEFAIAPDLSYVTIAKRVDRPISMRKTCRGNFMRVDTGGWYSVSRDWAISHLALLTSWPLPSNTQDQWRQSAIAIVLCLPVDRTPCDLSVLDLNAFV